MNGLEKYEIAPKILQIEQLNLVQIPEKSPKYFSPEDGLIAETCRPRGGEVNGWILPKKHLRKSLMKN